MSTSSTPDEPATREPASGAGALAADGHLEAAVDEAVDEPSPPAGPAEHEIGGEAGRRWRSLISSALRPGALSTEIIIALLFGLLGFSLVAEFAVNDDALTTARPEELVGILRDLNAREARLRGDLADLEAARDRLATGVTSAEDARTQAQQTLDSLSVLAGTVPVQGPGIVLTITDADGVVPSTRILDAVQELRDAGAESIEINGIRVVVSTWFTGGAGSPLQVNGADVNQPYRILAIGDPATMSAAMRIPGGVEDAVRGDGGATAIEEQATVTITSVAEPEPFDVAESTRDGR